MDSEYEIGFGKPPRKNQFKKGQSGNPAGRPKGARNRITMLHEELAQIIELPEGNVLRKMTKLEAMGKSAIFNGIKKGDPRPTMHFAILLEKLFPQPIVEDSVEVIHVYMDFDEDTVADPQPRLER